VAVEIAGGVDVDAELMGGKTGGDVGVSLGEDVGVDAEGEARGDVEEFSACSEEIELLRGFDVEEEDRGAEGCVDFVDLFAYSGEDGSGEGGGCGCFDAGQFSAGDDVEARAVLGQETEDAERGVGFDGIADGVGDLREGLLEHGQAGEDVVLRVDVKGGAVFGGERGERNCVAVEDVIAKGERACGGRRGRVLLVQVVGLQRANVRPVQDSRRWCGGFLRPEKSIGACSAGAGHAPIGGPTRIYNLKLMPEVMVYGERLSGGKDQC
jgi:hypothetical protein